jgi:transketolase
VSLCAAAAEKLAARGTAARVVSLPCLELFRAQPEAWRREILPADRVPVVAVEAARGLTLQGLVGARGFVYGIDRFGASAPYEKLAEEFGFTPDQLAAAVGRHLEKLAGGA